MPPKRKRVAYRREQDDIDSVLSAPAADAESEDGKSALVLAVC
jgi:hypothetical protein